METNSQKRQKIMRNGGKIKCPKCEGGFIAAVGNPETTNVFRCDTCGLSIVPTVLMK